MGGDIHIERDIYNNVINVLKPKLTMHIYISSIKGSIQPKNKRAHYCLGILQFKMYDQPNDYQKDPLYICHQNKGITISMSKSQAHSKSSTNHSLFLLLKICPPSLERW
jgi:hypothetical protein